MRVHPSSTHKRKRFVNVCNNVINNSISNQRQHLARIRRAQEVLVWLDEVPLQQSPTLRLLLRFNCCENQLKVLRTLSPVLWLRKDKGKGR